MTVRDAVLARAAGLSPGCTPPARRRRRRPAERRTSSCSTRSRRVSFTPWTRRSPPASCGPGRVRSRSGTSSRASRSESTIAPDRRVALHGAAVDALWPHGDHVRIAHHAEEAGDAKAVLAHAPLAGDRAARIGAHREAAAQYARALRFAGGLPDAERIALLEMRAREASLAGLVEEGTVAREEALTLARGLGDDLETGRQLCELARLYWYAGRRDDADRAAESAVAVLEAHPPGRELALAYAAMAHRRQIAVDPDGAAAWGGKALELAERLGADELVARTLSSIGTAEALAGRGTERLREALRLALARGLDGEAARAYGNLAVTSVRHRAWDEAEALPRRRPRVRRRTRPRARPDLPPGLARLGCARLRRLGGRCRRRRRGRADEQRRRAGDGAHGHRPAPRPARRSRGLAAPRRSAEHRARRRSTSRSSRRSGSCAPRRHSSAASRPARPQSSTRSRRTSSSTAGSPARWPSGAAGSARTTSGRGGRSRALRPRARRRRRRCRRGVGGARLPVRVRPRPGVGHGRRRAPCAPTESSTLSGPGPPRRSSVAGSASSARRGLRGPRPATRAERRAA